MQISDTEFETFVASALDELPEKYVANLSNVAIVYADDPSDHQRQKLKLRCGESLYGLYEGVPLTARGSGYNLVLPDKITIFKNPLVQDSPDLTALKANIKHTLWHEIAHHFGLGHGRIHQLERQALKKRDSV